MGIFDGFNNSKNQDNDKKEENAQKIQRYLNKYHMVSRDLDNTEAVKERDKTKDGTSAYAWQAYTWIEDATATSSERSNRYREYKEMCKVPELNQGLHIYCLHPDTVISTLNGDYTIKELSDGILGNEFDVWSYNIKENKVDVGKAKNPHITLKNTDVYKVIFDNGSEIIATDNHPFLLKTGEYKELGKLIPGDRITPFYSRIKQNRPVLSTMKYGSMDYYQYVYFLKTGKRIKKPNVIHHIDGNKYNNSFDNLIVMTSEEHMRLHMQEDKRIKKLIEITQQKTTKEKISKSWTNERKKESSDYIKNLYNSSPEYKTRIARPGNLNGRWIDLDIDIYEESKKYQTLTEMSNQLNIDRQIIERRIQSIGFTGWGQLREHHCLNLMSNNLDKKLSDLVNNSPYSRMYFYDMMKKIGYNSWSEMQENYSNHKVVSIEYYGKSDVYDMEVEEFHNFNANGVFVHNSDNATQYNISNNVLEILSDNQKIIEVLEKLFFERLDINSNLWAYTKNMCKFGDEFVEVILDSQTAPKNIVSLERIKKPENLKRKEKNNKLEGFEYDYGQEKDKENVKYEPWQIIHFSIEDDEYEPYGKSILEAGRKTFKRLSLMEDAMLIYRISRAPERRVFYIDVGTLSTKDANHYIEQLKRKFKKKSFVNSNTGEIDEKANPLCITLDTKIPLLDGRTLALSELIEEYNNGKENWVYSIDTNNGNQITPGKITWAGETRKSAQLIKVTLDNGKELRTTPDHRFMLRDGSYIEAQNLVEGQALMPLYTDKNSLGYEKVYNPKDEKYILTHQMVMKESKKIEWNNFGKGRTTHHIDFNKLNNSPDNLRLMDFWEHRNYHISMLEKTLLRPDVLKENSKRITKYNYSDKHKQDVSEANKKRNSVQAMSWYNKSDLHKGHNTIRSENLKKQFSDPQLRQKYIDGMTISNKIPENFWAKLIEIAQSTELNSQNYISFDNVIDNANNDKELISIWNEFCQNRQKNKINRNFMSRAILNEYELNTTKAWLNEVAQVSTKNNRSVYQNHKVAKIEWLNYTEDTGDITIDQYHNFATDSGVIVHNSVDEDFFIAVRENSQGTRIETLPPGQNLGEIDDVKYFKDMILKTLGIPSGYLGGNAEGATYDPKSYLSNQEVQFARTIERIQKFMVKGLEKVAIIQLALQKFEGDDLKNFKIKLTPPSNVDQLMEIEIRTQQFALVQSVKAITSAEGIPFLPDEWIFKKILGFSDKEISAIKLQTQMQMQLQAQMQAITAGMAAGGGGDMGGGMPSGMGGAAPEVAGGPAVGSEAPDIGAPEPAPAGGEPGLEVASNAIEFDGGKWLFENEQDVKKLLKYINLYEKIHKDNNDKKRVYEQNSATRMAMKGEFTGLLKASRSTSTKTLNERKTSQKNPVKKQE